MILFTDKYYVLITKKISCHLSKCIHYNILVVIGSFGGQGKGYLSKGKVLLDVEEASVVGFQFDLQEVFW